MTHPYFVSIKGLLFPERASVIIAPDEDELRREFGEAEHLMLPFQSVSLIEELAETAAGEAGKVIPFTTVESQREDER